MATRSKLKIALGVTSVTAVVLGVCYLLGGQPPDMRSPIRVSQASMFSDGGSAWIELTDVEGRRMAISVSGSLDRQPQDFPVYLQRWWPAFPLPVRIVPGSDRGQALLAVIDQAARDGGTFAAHELAPAHIALSGRAAAK